jgi:hypothetical protein
MIAFFIAFALMKEKNPETGKGGFTLSGFILGAIAAAITARLMGKMLSR